MTEPSPTVEATPENPFFRSLAEVVLRYRFVVIVLTLAASAFMGDRMVRGLRVDTSSERFLKTDDPSLMVLEEVRDHFGQDNLFLVLAGGDVFSMPYLERLKKLHDELASLDIEIDTLGQRRHSEPEDDREREGAREGEDENDEGEDSWEDEGWGDEDRGAVVEEVISLINVRRVNWRDGALSVEGLLDRWPAAGQLPALRTSVLSDRTLVGQVIDAKATQSIVVVRTDFMSEADQSRVHDEILRIAAAHDAEGFRILVTGVPALIDDLNRLTMTDQAAMTALATLVVLTVTLFIFRHPYGVLVPFVVVMQAVTWTLGLMAMLDVPLGVTTSLLTAFIVCVGCADTIHIQSVYRDARKKGLSNHDAIVHAVAATGIPIFYTTLTTAVGLLSFRLATIGGIAEMGTYSAFGVTAALVNSVLLLPALLSFNKKSLLGLPKGAERRRPADRLLDMCNGLSRPTVVDGKVSHTRRNRVLLMAGCLFAVAVAGISMLRLHHNAIKWIPREHRASVALRTYEATVGGAANIALLVEASEGKTVRDRDLLLSLQKLEDHLLTYEDPSRERPVVRNVTSLLDPIRESYRAVNGQKQEFYRLPETQRGVSDMLTLFESSGPEDFKRLSTVDMKKTLMVARTAWMDALSYKPLTRHLERGVEKLVGERATVKASGTIYVDITIISRLLMDLLRSFSAALVVITVIMLILLREIKLGLLAMIPNLLPILTVMGFMGFVSIRLDLATILLGSLAIGIVVDDTIHYLHQFKAHFDVHGDVESAIQHAFEHTGRALVITSMMLTAGFACNFFAQLNNYKMAGLLLSLTIALALLIDLCITPALLRAAYSSRSAAPSRNSS